MPSNVYIGAKLTDPTQAIKRISGAGDDIVAKLSAQLDECERREAAQTVALANLERKMAENFAKLAAVDASFAKKLDAINASFAVRR